MKIIAWLAGIGTLLGAGIYMIVSLNRWEWNRTLFFGLIVVIAEIGIRDGTRSPSAHAASSTAPRSTRRSPRSFARRDRRRGTGSRGCRSRPASSTSSSRSSSVAA